MVGWTVGWMVGLKAVARVERWVKMLVGKKGSLLVDWWVGQLAEM